MPFRFETALLRACYGPLQWTDWSSVRLTQPLSMHSRMGHSEREITRWASSRTNSVRPALQDSLDSEDFSPEQVKVAPGKSEQEFTIPITAFASTRRFLHKSRFTMAFRINTRHQATVSRQSITSLIASRCSSRHAFTRRGEDGCPAKINLPAATTRCADAIKKVRN